MGLAKINYISENIGPFLLVWLALALLLFIAIKKLLAANTKQIYKLVGVNLAVFIFLCSILFLAGETYFRFVFDASDPLAQIKTTQKWLERHVVTNADGFRDRNFSTEKAPGTIRIGVLGDSFAFGWGVDADKRFSNILEGKLLGKTNRKWEVYNVATPGWESKNELEFLEGRGGLFHFDIIILSYFLNDIYNDRAIDIDFYNEDNFAWRKNLFAKPILDRSYFAEFMLARAANYFNAVSADISQREISLYSDRQSWENHQKTLQGIVDWCQENNIELKVVVFPYLDLVGQEPYPAQFVHDKLTGFFQGNDVEILDLTSHLKKYSSGELRANPYDLHPSGLVHQITAELLFDICQEH